MLDYVSQRSFVLVLSKAIFRSPRMTKIIFYVLLYIFKTIKGFKMLIDT